MTAAVWTPWLVRCLWLMRAEGSRASAGRERRARSHRAHSDAQHDGLTQGLVLLTLTPVSSPQAAVFPCADVWRPACFGPGTVKRAHSPVLGLLYLAHVGVREPRIVQGNSPRRQGVGNGSGILRRGRERKRRNAETILYAVSHQHFRLQHY